MKEDTYHLGVKAVIRNSKGDILLLRVNPKELHGEHRDYWDLPGGRVQYGSNLEQTLRRELEEETGITTLQSFTPLAMVLSNLRIPLPESADVGLILSAYICTVGSTSRITLSKEHTAYRWLAPAKAAAALSIKYPAEFTEKIAALATE